MDHITNRADHINGVNHRNSLWGVRHTNRYPIAFFNAIVFKGASGFFDFFDEIFIGYFMAKIAICGVIWPLFG